MRIQKSRPLGVFPDFSNIKDETIRKFMGDLADLLIKEHRNIFDDIQGMASVDAVDTLPTITSEYVGRLLLLNGAGTGTDRLYLGIDTGSGGVAFKQVTLT